MPHVDNLSPSLLGAREALNQDNLCPDDRREDWSLLLPQIRSLRDTVLTAVARADTLTPDERAVTTTLIGPLAAVLYASGEKVAASELILAALPVADPETQSLWTSGERYLPAFVDLERARYHLRRGERDEAVRAAAAVDDHPAEPLAKAARVITGRKGHAPAARTWGAAHNRSYWPGAVGFGALLAVLVGILYLLSPNRTVSREFRALGAAPTGVALSPDARDQRLTQLESLIDREVRQGRVDRTTLADGAIAMIDVMAASPPRGLAEALGLLTRLSALPMVVRSDAMLDRLAPLVRGFIEKMNLLSSGATESALRLCASARRLDLRASSPLSSVEDEVRAALADRLGREGWAADAFLQQAMRQTPESVARAGEALRAMPEQPQLWLAIAPQVDAWLGRARATAPQNVSHASERLKASREQVKADLADGRPPSLEGLDGPALNALSARFPHDQEIMAARVETRRNNGDLPGALADLEGRGPVGHLIRPVQNLFAELLEQSGKMAEAEALLDRLFALDFAAYQAVRDRYDAAVDERSTELRPKGLAAITGGAEPASTEAERRLGAWVDKALLEDPALKTLRDELKARSPVIDVALRLGMLRLGRAMDESGEARATTLARAEQDFLAVSAYAGGRARYHLGLGQVYHRMGKKEAGDRELAAVLSRHDPELDLSVVRVYRDLDMIPRATELAQAVHKKAPPAAAREAAMVLSLMADRRAEKERWLREADQTMASVRADLLELEGDRLFEQGDLVGADKKYAEAEKIWLVDAETNSSSANNAALAISFRYRCTGAPEHMAASVRWFDTAVRLAPASAISAGNAARHFLYKAQLDVLDRWIDVEALRLAPWQADALVWAVLRGPLRAEALAALQRSPEARRSLALHRRQQMLAPQSIEGYDGQYDWYRSVGDEDALRALHQRLSNATLEIAQRKAAYERPETAAEKDERQRARQALIQMLESQESKLPKPEASARARRTHAALWMLRGLEHHGGTDEARAAFDAFVTARKLWPELSTARMSDPALLLALDEAAATHPPLSARWAKERKGRDAEAVVYDLVRAGDSNLLRALRKSPTLIALANERRAQLALSATAQKPGAEATMKAASGQIVDWSLGKVLDDERLVEAGAAHARWGVIQTSAEVTALLAPYVASAQSWSRMVKEIAGEE